MRDWKMRDWKMEHSKLRAENAGKKQITCVFNVVDFSHA